MCGWWLAPVLLAATEISPAVVNHGWFGLWTGGVLILLGLLGMLAAMFFSQRNRFKATRDHLEAQVVALESQRGVLETWLENQRLSGERRQKELEAEIERQRQAVAALRDSEYRFRNLCQQLSVGVFLVDVEGRCQYVNERWCQMIGLTAEQATGLPWMQFVHPDEREPVLRDWRTAVEQESGFVADHRFRGSSGRVAWLGTHIVPLRDRASRITSYLGVSVDIARFKRTEETLRASETRFAATSNCRWSAWR